MKRIVIEGGYSLEGTITIGGAKNSAVALIPAALLADGKSKITNVPNITDRDALFEIIKLLNCEIEQNNSEIQIDSTNFKNTLISQGLSEKLRASYYFMGVLLGKCKYVEIYFPGGCNIGTRPINLHIKGFKALGAQIKKYKHKYVMYAEKLKGATIDLDFASVGATVNIMFAAVKAEGTTIINNAAKEVEIINIADFLNKMGAKITGAGTGQIVIEGVNELKSADIEVIPDRIEAGTYIMMGALLGKNLKVEGLIPEHVESLTEKLREMGVVLTINENSIIINKSEILKPTNVKTLVYPGFPTDLGQPMSVVLTQAQGESNMEETIWENRVGHYPYLIKMGANIEVNNLKAKIIGPTKLQGTFINATDLRGGAALILAGLIASGETTIFDIDYILRGYENIINKLTNVGAKIRIEEI